MTAQWQPGNLYAPGDIVAPRITDAIAQSQMNNPDFESGDSGWDTGGNWSINQDTPYAGTWAAKFDATKMIAVTSADDDDNLATSVDGISWAISSMDAGTIFMNSGARIEVAESLGKWFVSDLINNKLYESTDGGASWSEVAMTGDVLLGPRDITWIEELGLMFAGEGTKLKSSPDGKVWTTRKVITGTGGIAAYDPIGDVLLMDGDDGAGKQIQRSTDGGITWAGANVGNDILGIIWDAGLGLFLGREPSSFEFYSSADGITWTTYASVTDLPGSSNKMAVRPSDGRIVMVMNGAPWDFSYSDDEGATWNNATTINLKSWSALIWNPAINLFVACEEGGNNSSFITSPDGDTWTERTTSYTGSGGWAHLAVGSAAVITRDALTNSARLAVTPGQSVTAQAFAKITGAYTAHVGVSWYNGAGALLGTSWTATPISLGGAYRRVFAAGLAPDLAATASVQIAVLGSGDTVYFDNVTISHTNPVTISALLFKATQADPGYSDSFEPTWPTVVGNTVVDNEVTWEGVPANRVVWQSFPILVSGSSEPTFPAAIGAEVSDNTISWVADTRRVEDPNCPNTKTVAITASKIFSGDGDIIPYSATINPLDWTTANDAGYIPFGLNTHGSQDVSALGLYRSNLVAFNSKGFQMWQVDEDPANFAILDAIAVGVPTSADKSLQPVSNDLVFLTEVGIRSMGIAGASTNLQAGDFGKQIDPLVKVKLDAGEVPISLYYPGAGQYWLIFGAEAFVLTMNGGKRDMSWSRYVFPSDIDDWTILDQDLMLRSGDKIWRLDDAAERDDQVGDPASSGTAFVGRIWWPYLDFGRFGGDKQMIGFDLVSTGAVTVTFGYDQTDDTVATAAYLLAAGDTLPGTLVPMPITGPSFQLRLEFSADQSTPWEWSGAILYLEDIGT